MQALVKQPSEVLKPEILFAGAGQLVQVVNVTTKPQGLVAGSAPLIALGAIVGAALVVTLTGGTDGERYLVTATAQDNEGQQLESELEVAVIDGEWTTPEGGSGYLSIKEFVDRFGLEEVVRMTDLDGSGRIDRAYLVNALSDAQALAEINIAAAYAVPLVEVPAIVKTAIADTARARLYPRGAPDGVDGAAKAANRILERISKGELQLPSQQPIAQAATSSPILVRPGARQYPDGLKDY
jgi:phage gp36-like protein